MTTHFYIETPCTSEPPRQPDTRIPVFKVNTYDAVDLADALAQASAFWARQGYYVIGLSRQTQNSPPPTAGGRR